MSINELIVFAVVATIVHHPGRTDCARPKVPPPATAPIPPEPHDFLTKSARPLDERPLPRGLSSSSLPSSTANDDDLNLFTRRRSVVTTTRRCFELRRREY